jgi:hypothetical protein
MPDRNIRPLRQTDQDRTDFALLESNLEIIMGQLAQLLTRGDLAKAAARDHLLLRSHHNSFRLGRLALTPVIAAVILALFAGPLAARENRSREVTRENPSASIPALPRGSPSRRPAAARNDVTGAAVRALARVGSCCGSTRWPRHKGARS